MDGGGSRMRLFLKIAGWLLGGLLLVGVVLPAVGLALLFLYLRVAQPETPAEMRVAGLSAPVEVVRDEHGLPHIFAANELDAYRALGWLHAADRLAQMEAQRRIGAGRAAEIVGSFALPLDRFMRTLGLYAQAEASYAELPEGARAAVDAYTEGVNAWLENREGPLPVEFQLLLHTPEPWRAADSLVYGKLMSLLGGSWRGELERAALLERLGPERLNDLYPEDPPGSPVTLAAGVDWVRFAASLTGLLPDAAASNWWALSGSRTATGKPILVNDPHLNIQVPSQWYLARIVTPELTLAGAFAPGVPFMIMGHNGHVAWGFTTPYSDTEDLFVETVDPADPARYLTEDGPRPFETRTETIRVRFGDAVEHVVRATRHGPVISDVNGAAREAAGAGRVVALASAPLGVADSNVGATWALNRARTLTEALEALRAYHAPHQNIALADTAGSIGFVSAGRIPVREGFDGALPADGATGTARWTGFIPFDGLPQRIDPPSGAVINANNRVAGTDFPQFIGRDFAEPWRAARIADLLGEAETVERQEAHLADILSLAALEMLPLLTERQPASSLEADALGQLRVWNGAMRADRPEPLIVEWWMMELRRAILRDELGPLFEDGLDARLLLHLIRNRPIWCDDTGTPEVETCEAMVGRALATTLDTLEERFGPHLYYWRWGEAHQVETGHALLARVPVLNWWFSNRFATDGGFYTVNRAGGWGRGGETPFAHNHGAVYRAIYDFADLGNSRFIALGGPSGDPLSDLFDTLTPIWAAGAHVRLTGGREELMRRGGGVTTFRP